jgi:hypothetical protein
MACGSTAFALALALAIALGLLPFAEAVFPRVAAQEPPAAQASAAAAAATKTADGKAGDGKAGDQPSFSAEQVRFFETEVQPLLKKHCLKCHGGEEKIRGGFRLTSRSSTIAGGDLGAAVKPGDVEGSTLVRAIEYRDLEMPPSGKLAAADIDVLKRWVRDGLPWTPGKEAVEPMPAAKSREGVVDAAARQYWAYQPIKRPEPPARPANVAPASIVNPIDAFIAARVSEAGLAASPPADPIALVRRAYYDLLGLPPTPAQVEAFTRDPSPAAYEKLIETLLDSPHYGEKWGRHWLDLVRYAESNGYERDSTKPLAWRYRDYVINAFNQDKPYDRFLLEQLAGDELDDASLETLTATGYYRLGIWDDEPADRPLAKFDAFDGIVSTTAQVMLGMSLGCARCHDHKKDPIPHRDYYRMLAFFRDVSDMNGRNTRMIADQNQQATQRRLIAEKESREARLYGEIFGLQQQFLAAWRKAEDAAKRQADPGVNAASDDADDADDVAATPDIAELNYRFYRDTFESLPDFASLKAETQGPITDGFLSLSPASRQEAIGLVFEGRLKVPAAGEYTFDYDATEGLRLVVGGQTVVNEPGKGRHAGEVKARLEAGLLPLRLEYFNSYAKPRLRLGWKAADGARRPLSLDGQSLGGAGRVLLADSRGQAQTWSYTFQKPAADWATAGFDASSWKRGPGGFGTNGTPGAVVRTEWRSGDIWLRTTFSLDRLPRRLALDLHHDEDVEVYINGEKVYSAQGYLREYERVPLGREAAKKLRMGENVLAVHCRQTGGGQYIDVGLAEAGGVADFATLLKRDGARVWDAALVEKLERLSRELEESRKAKPPEAGLEVMCVAEAGRAPTFVLLRGNPGAEGEKVAPGFPAVLCSTNDETVAPVKLNGDAANASSGKRRALAEWIVGPSNPLTARVMANRLWQYHFGRGIVPTPNDFGLLGESPTHPQLLDWLAIELRDGGWKLKRMHKLIMMSATYRQSSAGNAAALTKDPGNELWWRYPMRRLTAEEIRDSILAVSGRINLQLGGPSVYPPIPREVLAGQSVPGAGWGKATPEEASRRSVYIHVKRSLVVPLLSLNDAADTDNSCPVRYTTTVPTQALGMLNGEFTNEQAAFLARRLMVEKPSDLAAQCRLASLLVSSRSLSEVDLREDLKLIADLRERYGLSAEAALTQYCLLLLNTNAFVYLD